MQSPCLCACRYSTEQGGHRNICLPNCALLELSSYLQEAGVEKELVNLLCKLSAQHYLPILAHHRVTTEALRHMNSSDLKKVCLQHHYQHISISCSFDISYCLFQHQLLILPQLYCSATGSQLLVSLKPLRSQICFSGIGRDQKQT